jgi:hypothetical protein
VSSGYDVCLHGSAAGMLALRTRTGFHIRLAALVHVFDAESAATGSSMLLPDLGEMQIL